MALIKDGWWQDTWFCDSWWQQDWWLEYGVASAPTPTAHRGMLPLRKPKPKKHKTDLFDDPEFLQLLIQFIEID